MVPASCWQLACLWLSLASQLRAIKVFSHDLHELPTGWESAVDPASGAVYFFNRASGIRQWESPAEAAVDSTSLPQGWETAVDPETNNSYYFNRGTGVTQWQRPSQAAAAPASTQATAVSHASAVGSAAAAVRIRSNASAGSRAAVAVQPTTEQQQHATNVTNQSTSLLSAGGNSSAATADKAVVHSLQEGAAQLPVGWESAVDDSTKLRYYFNRAKNLTQWEFPAEVVHSAGTGNGNVSSTHAIVELASNQTVNASLSVPKLVTTGNHTGYDEGELRAYLQWLQKAHPGSLQEEVRKTFTLPEGKLHVMGDADSPVDAALDLIMDEAELQYRVKQAKEKQANEPFDPEEKKRKEAEMAAAAKQRATNASLRNDSSEVPSRSSGGKASEADNALLVAEVRPSTKDESPPNATHATRRDEANVAPNDDADVLLATMKMMNSSSFKTGKSELRQDAKKKLLIEAIRPAAELQQLSQAAGGSVVEISSHGQAALSEQQLQTTGQQRHALPPPPPLSSRQKVVTTPAAGSGLLRREGGRGELPPPPKAGDSAIAPPLPPPLPGHSGTLLEMAADNAAEEGGGVANAQALRAWAAMQANSTEAAGQSPSLALSACVWQECVFSGRSHCFSGTTACTNVDSFGMEQEISSLMTGDGFKIKVYSQQGCTGSWLWLARYAAGIHALECLDSYSFAGTSWDNQVRSLKVCLRDGEC
eukprot:TRINITY_DN45643_c0_g1_i2.p1 TRINITY_DN45643_c0_g1~~TRINITY_DN45643_c0_g1_i2.p1  ORF type:complete len:707 (-),score=205.86 TRINITY_DN45643_c0_g1_i2:138-2258(-)